LIPDKSTEDHKYLVCKQSAKNIKNGKNISCVWDEAKNLRVGDYLVCPDKFEKTEKPSTDIDLPKFGPKPQPLDWLVNSQEGMYILGYFIGDGFASEEGDGQSVEFAIAQKDEEIGNFIFDTFSKNGYKPRKSSYYKQKECQAYRIRIHSRSLCRWLRKHFYDENKVKVFPSWAYGDKDFIRGLFDADGHYIEKTTSKKVISSTSLSITYGSLITLTNLHYEPTVREVIRRSQHYPNAKPIYQITWNENPIKPVSIRKNGKIFRRINKIEEIETLDKVYDIGVESDDHAFISNGVVTHNCVSQAWAGVIDCLKATEIVLKGENEKWIKATASEPIYGFARVEIGGGRLGGDGCYGSWGAKSLREYGTLMRQKYGDYDLTRYSGRRARDWGRRGRGVPNILEPTAREHPVRTTSLVRTYEECRDAIANGYPVNVCSNQGFSKRRDSEGFSRPSGSWSHSMLFAGVDDSYKRPGLLCINSWGHNWISGPKRHDQPNGSFWVDASVVNRMLRQYNDSFSASGFEGYPARKLTGHMAAWA